MSECSSWLFGILLFKEHDRIRILEIISTEIFYNNFNFQRNERRSIKNLQASRWLGLLEFVVCVVPIVCGRIQ